MTIPNVNTPFQRLRPVNIPYGNIIYSWDMGCYLIYYSSFWLPPTTFLFLSYSYLVQHHVRQYSFSSWTKRNWQVKFNAKQKGTLWKHFVTLGTRLVHCSIGLSASHNRKYWYLVNLTQKWQKQWKHCSSDNSQCQYSIPKAQTCPYLSMGI